MNKITNTKNLYIVKEHAKPEVRYTAFNQYNKLELTAPAGYEFTGEFRQGLAREKVLGMDGKAWDGAELSERLILKKIDEPTPVTNEARKSFLFKYLGFVAPKVGQYFDTYDNQHVFERVNNRDFSTPHHTYERVEI